MTDTDALLHIEGLKTHFTTTEGIVKAVDGVDITVRPGSTMCVVGESGSGKSITARSVMQLVDAPGEILEGKIWWNPSGDDPVDLAAMDSDGEEIRKVRGGQIGMVFQEPMASLSPMYTIGAQLTEAMRLHRDISKAEARTVGIEWLDRVGMADPKERFDTYPFQLSGGMCQRAMIAIALSCDPQLLIADEPTTALDVTTQARILELLMDLQSEFSMAMMFITHDLGVVAEIAEDVTVMNKGKVMETGTVHDIFNNASHPYTKRLLSSTPKVRTLLHERSGPATTKERTKDDDGEDTGRTPLLDVQGLVKEYQIGGGMFRRAKGVNRAVKGIDLTIEPGQTMGLVGESGCGKTTTGRCIARLLEATEGKILYTKENGEQVDLRSLEGNALKPYRTQLRVIFQDPFSSLNPRMTVEQIVSEPLRVHEIASGKKRKDLVADMLKKVGIKPDHMVRYPHAFSGGERQRINIARALITNPRLVVADEPVSALDVSIRAQILDLLTELQEDLGLTYLFISHDLSVVEHITDHVTVMYQGEFVEQADTQTLFTDPQHEYTQKLLESIPIPDPSRSRYRRAS